MITSVNPVPSHVRESSTPEPKPQPAPTPKSGALSEDQVTLKNAGEVDPEGAD